MTTPSDNPRETIESAETPAARDPQTTWAKPVDRLAMGAVPDEAINLNVSGKRLTGPLQGFGQLWQKTYRLRFEGADPSPQEVVSVWKREFGSFWPENAHFYAPFSEIAPGEVGLINNDVAGGQVLSTGVMVIYADDESFTFMTPQGHLFSGWITFSAFADDATTVAQIQLLIRAGDPITELSFRLGFGHRMEDTFWRTTLENLAGRFGVRTEATQQVTCVDPRVQWSEARNLWHSSAIRSAFYTPVRWVRGMFRR